MLRSQSYSFDSSTTDSLKSRMERYRRLEVPKTDGLEGMCWVWTEALYDGYGRINVKGTPLPVYKVAWAIYRGDQPWGDDPLNPLEPDHLCHNRACFRPSHLDWKTHSDNMKNADLPNKFKTGCPKEKEHGPYDYQYPDGRRGCSKCDREANTRYRERRSIRSRSVGKAR